MQTVLSAAGESFKSELGFTYEWVFTEFTALLTSFE